MIKDFQVPAGPGTNIAFEHVSPNLPGSRSCPCEFF
jgi:hypothetical protein